MGYWAPTNLTASLSVVPISITRSGSVVGTTSAEVYGVAVDFTDIQYLGIFFNTFSSANLTDFNVKIDSTSIWSGTNRADGSVNSNHVDVSSYTGEHNLIFFCNNTNAGDTSRLHNMNIYGSVY